MNRPKHFIFFICFVQEIYLPLHQYRNMTTSTTTLCLSAHDELYIIDLKKVIYMQADDHYTHVFYSSTTHFMVPYGLGDIESRLMNVPRAKSQFIRLGRKYIINLKLIFRISTIKETLSLTDGYNGTIEIHVSKPVLRSLIDLMKQ